jgi:hypothetical protein
VVEVGVVAGNAGIASELAVDPDDEDALIGLEERFTVIWLVDTVVVEVDPAVLAVVIRGELQQSIEDECVCADGRNDCDVHER